LFITLSGALLLALFAFARSKQIEVMLMDGQSGGAYHNWHATTPGLKKELEDTGLFHVTVVTFPPSGGDFRRVKPEFGKIQGDCLQSGFSRVARRSEVSIRGLRKEGRRLGHCARRRQRLSKMGPPTI
jgi:hypothetical protein